MQVTNSSNAIDLQGVSRFYGRGASRVKALDEVSLQCSPGSFTAIMGPSGSGKSTLLQCAAGLDQVDSGSVAIVDNDITRMGERKLTQLRSRHVGFVFQQFNLLPALTVRQNIALPSKLAGKALSRSRVDEILGWVGLDGMSHRRPDQLSGGQQQRVAIARALAEKPSILFADEPTGALDSRTAEAVMRLLKNVVQDSDTAILLVTHDPVVASYADRVVFLVDGAVARELVCPTAVSVGRCLEEVSGRPGNAAGHSDSKPMEVAQ